MLTCDRPGLQLLNAADELLDLRLEHGLDILQVHPQLLRFLSLLAIHHQHVLVSIERVAEIEANIENSDSLLVVGPRFCGGMFRLQLLKRRELGRHGFIFGHLIENGRGP